ncbi:unnamed protein product [Caenorhabditis brenneri]
MSDKIPPSFIGMPEDVMRIILEKCDFVSIQCLRKTCHDLRNFIDDNKLKLSVDAIRITYYPKRIKLNFDSLKYPARETIFLFYQKLDGEDPKVIWDRSDVPREKIIENEKFTDAFSRDLGSILACKLPILDQFYILKGVNGSDGGREGGKKAIEERRRDPTQKE